jgi:hypothetical protein
VAPETPDGQWVWAGSWDPGPGARAMRHRVANLLAPVAVAAELIDGESDELVMLRRSTDVLRRQLGRVGELLRPPELRLRNWSLPELLGALEVPGSGEGHLQVDAVVLAERLCDELGQQGDAALDARVAEVDLGAGIRPCLVLRSHADTEPLSREALELLALPLSSPRAGCGLALAVQATHLHGGKVRGRSDVAIIEAIIPLHLNR